MQGVLQAMYPLAMHRQGIRPVWPAIGTTRDEYGPLAGCISCQNSALERLERAAGLVTKQYRTDVGGNRPLRNNRPARGVHGCKGHFRYVHNSYVLTPTALHTERSVNFLQDSATILVKTRPVASAGKELSRNAGA